VDTSKEYIEMCEKAVEIQDKWIPQSTDIVKGEFVGFIKEASPNYALRRFDSDKEIYGKYAWYEKMELIWIPRQDQLQDMVNIEVIGYSHIKGLILGFKRFCMDQDDKSFNTMEQLWLAFVMKEKYSKSWNGKEWVKTK